MAAQRMDYEEQTKRIKELTALINERARIFTAGQKGKNTWFGDLAATCQTLEEAARFLGAKVN